MTSNSTTMDWFASLLDRFDGLPSGVRVAVMVVGFVMFWPIGLAILGYLMWNKQLNLWSGAMGCNRNHRHSRSRAWSGYSGGRGRSSGNRAFDEYRDTTLKQLEEDQIEFANFVDQLRRAKDQNEFDAFMADRMRKAREENGGERRPEDGGVS